jgi:hypothetical protein
MGHVSFFKGRIRPAITPHYPLMNAKKIIKNLLHHAKLLSFKSRDRVRRVLREKGMPTSNNEYRLRQFRNCHLGKRCFIIGNGPSLTIEDLEKIKGEVSYASNKIYLIFKQTSWRPTYYVAEDDKIIRDNLTEINALAGPLKLLRRLKCNKYVPKDQVAEFEMYFPDSETFPQFTLDATKPFACGYTVTYVAMQWAFYMGFENVYLLGVDFNYPGLKYHADGTVELPEDGTHFLPGYGSSGERFYAPKLDENLRAYALAKDIFLSNGRSIFNATRGGKLEIFPRVDFDTLFDT